MSLHRARPGIGRPPDESDRAAQAEGTLSEQRAREISAHLGATHPDRDTHQWLPRHGERGWQVVRIALPPPLQDLSAETHADTRPAGQDDVRTPYQRNVGEWGGPG